MNFDTKHNVENNVFTTTISFSSYGTENGMSEKEERELFLSTSDISTFLWLGTQNAVRGEDFPSRTAFAFWWRRSFGIGARSQWERSVASLTPASAGPAPPPLFAGGS